MNLFCSEYFFKSPQLYEKQLSPLYLHIIMIIEKKNYGNLANINKSLKSLASQ